MHGERNAGSRFAVSLLSLPAVAPFPASSAFPTSSAMMSPQVIFVSTVPWVSYYRLLTRPMIDLASDVN